MYAYKALMRTFDPAKTRTQVSVKHSGHGVRLQNRRSWVRTPTRECKVLGLCTPQRCRFKTRHAHLVLREINDKIHAYLVLREINDKITSAGIEPRRLGSKVKAANPPSGVLGCEQHRVGLKCVKTGLTYPT
jgi:hypothetical protein